MSTVPLPPARCEQTAPGQLRLSGTWTAFGLGAIQKRLDTLSVGAYGPTAVDAARIEALDTAGASTLHALLLRLRGSGAAAAAPVPVQGLKPQFARLLGAIESRWATAAPPADAPPRQALAERVGRSAVGLGREGLGLLAFVGETATVSAATLLHPARLRWRPVLFNIRSAGVDALPIVGLLSFLLGVVVAYQGAGTLRQYGANVFVADLVGLSMLREFAPLIVAIIVAGRSGSAYAAQIGTMAVTEEIDALRTLGIAPQELLVLPKLIALVIAMPLLTVFADVLGVLGGMLMARGQLGVGFAEFLDRFVKAVGPSAFLIGIVKAPVFAAIIATVGCHQGFATRGGAESVGRQTTRAVVQATFLVIVADALFSVAFSALGL
jgi:phospholipid/cholesterol/gamma-HCH transport system permease protein